MCSGAAALFSSVWLAFNASLSITLSVIFHFLLGTDPHGSLLVKLCGIVRQVRATQLTIWKLFSCNVTLFHLCTSIHSLFGQFLSNFPVSASGYWIIVTARFFSALRVVYISLFQHLFLSPFNFVLKLFSPIHLCYLQLYNSISLWHFFLHLRLWRWGTGYFLIGDWQVLD